MRYDKKTEGAAHAAQFKSSSSRAVNGGLPRFLEGLTAGAAANFNAAAAPSEQNQRRFFALAAGALRTTAFLRAAGLPLLATAARPAMRPNTTPDISPLPSA